MGAQPENKLHLGRMHGHTNSKGRDRRRLFIAATVNWVSVSNLKPEDVVDTKPYKVGQKVRLLDQIGDIPQGANVMIERIVAGAVWVQREKGLAYRIDHEDMIEPTDH